MNRHCDLLIIGSGLAGSILAWQLNQAGLKPLIVSDPGIPSASRAAAGLINPVTGQRMVLQDNINTLLTSARQLYRDIEKQFDCTLFHAREMLRVFRSGKEKSAWERRKNSPEYQPFISGTMVGHCPNVAIKHGATIQYHTGYLDTNSLLDTLHNYFRDRNQLIESALSYDDIILDSGSVHWHDIHTNRIIFCEGWRAMHNPWFDWLPFQPAKGEILTLTHSNKLPDQIINAGKWLLPVSEHTFRFGATYQWHEINDATTDAARDELIQAMDEIVEPVIQARITNHVAGVRPGTQDKQPFLGLHPEHPELGIFNGFGSKGSLLIPWHTEQFVSHLINGSELPAAADITRCYG